MFRRWVRVFFLLVVIAGCVRVDNERDESPEATPVSEEFEFIECISEVDSIDVPMGETREVRLRAVGVPVGAHESETIDVTEQAWWTVLRGEGVVGADGVYTTPDDRGGLAVVEVQLQGLVATCTFEMHLQIWRDGAGSGLTAQDVLDHELEGNDECAAVVVYPTRDTAFPPNQVPPEVQWLPSWWDDLYVVDIESDYVHVLATTRAHDWEADFELLRILSRSHDEGRAAFDLRVLSASFDFQNGGWGGALCTSSRPLELEVSNVRLPGSVVYWSPVTEGLWSIEIGGTEAVPLLDPDQVGCVGCHALNTGAPDRLSMAWGERAVVSRLEALEEPLVTPSDERPGRFTILDDSSDRLVRSWDGVLYVDDASTGASLGELPTVGYATHPTINSDGDRLVYSSCASGDGWEWNMVGCGLRVLETDGNGELTVDRELVPSTPGWNHYYPSISPDGQWVIYNRSTGDTHDDRDAEVMLIPLVFEGGPIRLDRANGGLMNTNSWPRWGPMVEDRAWLSFSSRRSYGARDGGGAPQVWLAEVDLALAWSGFDPSRSAIRLPGQDLDVGNHTPVWVPRGSGL